MLKVSTLAAAFILGATSSHCLTKQCTEIGCPEGVRFEMTPPVASQGDVTVELTSDVVQIGCTQAIGSVTGSCYDAGLTFEVENGVLRAISMFGRLPEAVSLTVRVGGVVERQVSTDVEYRTEKPNGPDCPGCRAATVAAPPPG